MNQFQIGTVIHGTYRHENLIPAFLNCIHQLDNTRFLNLTNKYEINYDNLGSFFENFSQEEISFLLDDLYDSLNEIASEYDCYFGSLEGDGSDFGFWKYDELS